MTFARAAAFSVESAGAQRELGPSDPIPGLWDRVIWHGVVHAGKLRAEVSRQRRDGAWGPWVPAAARVFEGGRFWARAEVAHAGARVRLRLAAADGRPARVTVYAVEAFEDKGEPRRAGWLFGKPPPRPPVFTREQWGAKTPREPYEQHLPVAVTVHHTAGALPRTANESIQEVRFIQDYHQNGRGWNDIGYHYLIDSGGRVFEGRPELAVGAHALGHNEGTLGIAFLGYHHPPESHPVAAPSIGAMVIMGRYLRGSYPIEVRDLRGHRDLRDPGLPPTDCPGDGVYALLDQFRRRIQPPPATVSAFAAPAF